MVFHNFFVIYSVFFVMSLNYGYTRYPQENHSNKLKINAPRASVADAFFPLYIQGLFFIYIHTLRMCIVVMFVIILTNAASCTRTTKQNSKIKLILCIYAALRLFCSRKYAVQRTSYMR